jgi:hypothetical protein
MTFDQSFAHLAFVSFAGRPFRAENGAVAACRRRSSMVR